MNSFQTPRLKIKVSLRACSRLLSIVNHVHNANLPILLRFESQLTLFCLETTMGTRILAVLPRCSNRDNVNGEGRQSPVTQISLHHSSLRPRPLALLLSSSRITSGKMYCFVVVDIKLLELYLKNYFTFLKQRPNARQLDLLQVHVKTASRDFETGWKRCHSSV